MTTPQIVATVEVYTETDLTNAIIGGSVGGFVLLALITAGLVKVIHSIRHNTIMSHIMLFFLPS